ncbi:MAG TPA: tyrosine--tRNA ligase [Candidatus Paceibacterota bacterium]|jgi:tyrosyl-tRNA synthetase|nr:tyrosine--tRNA ligase [Candidatus Paceibacterota bacterium]
MNRDDHIETVLTKGVEAILPNRAFLEEKLKKGVPLTIYTGFDPSAPTLHIGHAITLRKLRQFQDLGHRIIFLIGDFTGRIGDPTDKSAVRVQLSDREVKKNWQSYKAQAGKFIRFNGKNAAMVKRNSRWLSRLTFSDVVELAAHFTVDQMLKRDMFVRRMKEEKPIYLHEFLYPLMQGYDSVAMNVDGEVGGNDQLFNMLTGRTLLQQMKGKEKFVLTMKLLEDSTGKKMGKSEGNMVALSETPESVYGKVMSWADGLIASGFELCTDYTKAHVDEVVASLASGTNPRDLKMRLAFEITKSMSDEKSAQRAQEQFINVFQKGASPEVAHETEAKDTLKDTILNSALVPSNSELRRLVAAGAITLEDGEKVTYETLEQAPKKATYKIGKNRFLRVR